MMSRCVKTIPGQTRYPSLQIFEIQFICHNGQSLVLLLPTPPLHPSHSKPQKPNEREENKGEKLNEGEKYSKGKGGGGKEITNKFKSMTIY